MRHRCVAAGYALAVALLAAPSAARADQPLRSLVYAISSTVQAQRDSRISGLTGGDPLHPHGMEYGRAAEQHGMSAEDRGTLRVDVVAATSDGGLVVDVAYDGSIAKQAPIRVAIFADGGLAYDPKRGLVMEARQVLPLLGRGVFAGRDISPGSDWSIPFAAPASGATWYRVQHREETRAEVAIRFDLSVTGPNGFVEHGDGTATYATDVLCPVSYDVRLRVRHDIDTEQVETTNTRIIATLTSDSFAKR